MDLPDALNEVLNRDPGGVADFYDLLNCDDFRDFMAKLTDVLETGSNRCGFWAKWIEAILERTPPELDPNQVVERA